LIPLSAEADLGPNRFTALSNLLKHIYEPEDYDQIDVLRVNSEKGAVGTSSSALIARESDSLGQLGRSADTSKKQHTERIRNEV
jgi:hypothetical protein